MSSASSHALGIAASRLPSTLRLSSCANALDDSRGQSTVEASFALPILMVLVLLLLQPGIVLYDRIVMSAAAAEGCRLLATSGAESYEVSDDFIRRRLGAIPELDQFHVHSRGCSWEIELMGDESSDVVTVRLTTEAKPLPLIDSAMGLFGMTNGMGNMLITVESTQQVQPDWIENATDGRSPSGWVGI